MNESVEGLVDHLFRHSAGQMVATLTRILGSEHLELAEEVVQEALVSALQVWGLRGVPEDRAAWLFQVARNRALDQLRRRASFREKEAAIVEAFRVRESTDEPGFAHELRDDQLQMMLMCCHPAIPEDSRIALTLKTVGGFSVEEIAAAFLSKPEAIAQRIVRAKRLIRDEQIPMELPSRPELPERLESLLKVLYLMFNEGYSAVRPDVSLEAIRLARLVADHPVAGSPSAQALLALMLLQGARLPARVDAAGEIATLADQDRSLWDGGMIAEGIRRLDRAAWGDTLSVYHLEAAIAAFHVGEPDWNALIDLYDQLLTIKPSPVVALNRAVAVAMAHGPEAGIRAIDQITAHATLDNYLPFAVTLGELWLRAGHPAKAAGHFSRALDLASTEPEKRFLRRKVEQCRV
jgi:RNA polymerase sigma-70 factor, ECF subfamily